MKYAWIHAHRDEFPVSTMCKLLGVSRSGFYQSRKAEPSQRQTRSERIRVQVKLVHEQSEGIYGSYKIADVMKNDEELETACRNTVAKAMQEMELKSCVSATAGMALEPSQRPPTQSSEPPATPMLVGSSNRPKTPGGSAPLDGLVSRAV